MDREAVAAVVKRRLLEVLDDLDESAIDTTRSMRELGANSLDIVEVVSCAMRDLKVKVPRSDLSKLTTMDGLIDMLHQAASEKPSSETAP